MLPRSSCGLSSTSWSAESTQALTHWREAAEAPTQDVVIRAVLATDEHDGTDAAANIRRLLALDAYNEDAYS